MPDKEPLHVVSDPHGTVHRADPRTKEKTLCGVPWHFIASADAPGPICERCEAVLEKLKKVKQS